MQQWQLLMIIFLIGFDMQAYGSDFCDETLNEIKHYIQAGGNPDRETSESLGTNPSEFDLYRETGPRSLLGDAVQLECVEQVTYLLEHGANPNVSHLDASPLLRCFIALSETGDIEDEEERETVRANLVKIRDVLIAHGAVVDWGSYWRRKSIREFREKIAKLGENGVYIYITEDTVVFEGANIQEAFQLYSDGVAVGSKSLSGKDASLLRRNFLPQLQAWIDVHKGEDLYFLSILSENKNDIHYTTLAKLKDAGWGATFIAIPHYFSCEPDVLLKTFLENEDTYTEVLMNILNEVCPAPYPRSPYSPEVEEYLRTTPIYAPEKDFPEVYE